MSLYIYIPPGLQGCLKLQHLYTEMVPLQVAEAAVDDLRLDGSLIIEADGVYGRPPASAEDPLASPAPFNPGPRVR